LSAGLIYFLLTLAIASSIFTPRHKTKDCRICGKRASKNRGNIFTLLQSSKQKVLSLI
jgi:hypothetical protein